MCKTPDCDGRTFGDDPYCYGCREDLLRPLLEATRADLADVNSSSPTARHFHELLKDNT